MTKANLITQIVAATGLDRHDVQITVEHMLLEVKKSLAAGEAIYLRGFGTFNSRLRAKKVARNITKNTSMVLEPHYVPHFKPGKDFKATVKNSKPLSAKL